jgi:hypothetical protein
MAARVDFRCWYCGRRYLVAAERIGERRLCGCGHRLRVPRRSGASSQARTAGEWLLELVVYGGGGALLGFGLALLLVSQVGVLLRFGTTKWLIVGLTVLGGLAGGLGGERGINWIGGLIRGWEERGR